MSLIKQKREEIIRGLDVLSVGPYLVRNGVLSQQKYTEEFGNLIEDGRAVNEELTPKLYEVILKKPVEFCKALEESVKETQHEGHQELLTILQQNVKKAKRIKKGLMTRAAHKVKKTFKSKQKLLSVDKRSISPYGEYSGSDRSDDELSMVSQDYGSDAHLNKPWYHHLSTSSTSLASTSVPNVVVINDQHTTQAASYGNISDDNSSSKDQAVDEPDHNDSMKDVKVLSSNHKTVETKTEFKSDSSYASPADLSILKQKADTEKWKLEQENKTLKEQLLALRVEVKKDKLLMQQQKDAANSREAELKRKMEEMQAEHDTVCAEMGTKNAELILKLESLQEMYTNEFHGTVHVKQLQVRLEAERQKVKRLEKEKNLAFGKQDLYKVNEQLTKELSQAKAEISYLRHMVPKKYLQSQGTDGNSLNDD